MPAAAPRTGGSMRGNDPTPNVDQEVYLCVLPKNRTVKSWFNWWLVNNQGEDKLPQRTKMDKTFFHISRGRVGQASCAGGSPYLPLRSSKSISVTHFCRKPEPIRPSRTRATLVLRAHLTFTAWQRKRSSTSFGWGTFRGCILIGQQPSSRSKGIAARVTNLFLTGGKRRRLMRTDFSTICKTVWRMPPGARRPVSGGATPQRRKTSYLVASVSMRPVLATRGRWSIRA